MSDHIDLVGRLVLRDRIAPGRIRIADGRIDRIELGGPALGEPILAPGFVDIHVHGWGGHDAMDGPVALDGMARSLARRGVTSFLPTAVTATLPQLARFADDVRRWARSAPSDGAAPVGFGLEGPFLAPSRAGAHEPALLRDPADVDRSEFEPLLDGLRLITIAPERPGALALIGDLAARGVRVALGHSEATLAEARGGYAAGAVSTTHLFNAMTGLGHREPGLAAAALLDDAVWTELVADGHHVHPALWPLILRLKPQDRMLLVSDAIAPAGTAIERTRIGNLEVEIHDDRVTLGGTTTLAGSVIALDDAVRNVAGAGMALPAVIAAASSNPSALLGLADRGALEVGRRADIVALDHDLRVRRVWIAGLEAGG